MDTQTTYKQLIDAENAPTIAKWVERQGGLAVWGNLSLSEQSFFMTSAFETNGVPTKKPSYKATSEPVLILTDPTEIGVVTYQEVKRFHVALRVSGNGLMLKLTSASNERLNRELQKAGPGSTYQFDYSTQEAAVFKPTQTISLQEWIANHTNGGNHGTQEN